MLYKEIKGNLIELALNGEFDVIAHGCNCFCKQKSGIAKGMVYNFDTDKYLKEDDFYKGDINKLGNIEIGGFPMNEKSIQLKLDHNKTIQSSLLNQLLKYDVNNELNYLYVVNCYTQYRYGTNHPDGQYKPVDYSAIKMCMKKINYKFKGKHIGLPKIGCGLAGGDWNIVKKIIQDELIDCKVTIAIYDKKL